MLTMWWFGSLSLQTVLNRLYMSSWLDKADSNCNVEDNSQETKGEICLGGKKGFSFSNLRLLLVPLKCFTLNPLLPTVFNNPKWNLIIQLPRVSNGLVPWFVDLSSTSSTSSGKADVYHWVRAWMLEGHAGAHESLLELSHLTLWNDMTKRNKFFYILLFTQKSWSDHHDSVRCCFDDFDLCWFYFEGFFRWFSHSTCDMDQAFLGRWHRQLVRPRWAGNWCRGAMPNKEYVYDIFLHKTCMFQKKICYSRNSFLVATV